MLQIVEFEKLARDGAAVTPAPRVPFLLINDLHVPAGVADAHQLLDQTGLVRLVATESCRLWVQVGGVEPAGSGYWLPANVEMFFDVDHLEAVTVYYMGGTL